MNQQEQIVAVMRIFDEIGNASSRIEKETILKNNKNDILFKEILMFVYNPYITTGLSDKKIQKEVKMPKPDFLSLVNSLLDMFDYIKKFNTGRDTDIGYVKAFINQFTDEVQDFLVKIFTKNLKIGITSKTINKVFGKIIPEYSVMVGEKYEDNANFVEGKTFILTKKIDGNRLTCIKNNQDIKFYTRNGQTVEGLIELEKDFATMPNGVYDGEVVAQGKFEDSKSMFKETMKRFKRKGIKTGVKMICFDYIENIQDFYNGIDTTPTQIRKQKLQQIIQENSNIKFIENLDILYIGKDIFKINEFIQLMTQQKEEGLMLNIADAPYENKRTKNLLKVKLFKTADLRVVDYEEGTGKNKGRLGALVVSYKDNLVKVGSGFTDEMRTNLWIDINNIINKIIEIQYFEETQNEQGKYSLRFPTFVRIREDKTEESIY